MCVIAMGCVEYCLEVEIDHRADIFAFGCLLYDLYASNGSAFLLFQQSELQGLPLEHAAKMINQIATERTTRRMCHPDGSRVAKVICGCLRPVADRVPLAHLLDMFTRVD